MKFATVLGALTASSSSAKLPMLVLNSTRGFCAHAPDIASKRRTNVEMRCMLMLLGDGFRSAGGATDKLGSDRSLIDDAPASVFVQPVLALLHRIRQIIRPVLLVEAHQHQAVLAGIAEHAEIAHLDFDPGLAAVHEALVPAPAIQALVRCGEVFRIMHEVAFRIEAFPVGSPLFPLLSKRCSLGCPILEAQPFNVLADDDGRDADLKVARQHIEIGIGEDNTAVTRTRGSAVGVRWRSVQPDAMAVAPLNAVPLVRVVDRESAASVEIREFLPGQARRNVIHPDRGLLVSFPDFQRPVFSRAHVIVGDKARFPAVVLVQIKPRAARVDDDCVLLVLAQLQQIARYMIRRRALSVGSQAGERFGPQSFHLRLRYVGGRADCIDRPGAREQQVALDQMSKTKVGSYADQSFDILKSHVEMSPNDFFVDRCKQSVCRHIDARTLCGGQGGGGSKGNRCDENAGDVPLRHQPPARSCWMSQRPSLRTMTSVLLLLIFRLSERYVCRKLTTALFWSLSVTLGDSTATSIFLGLEMRCLRAASHSERPSPFGVLKS